MKSFICINLYLIAGVNSHSCYFGLQVFTPVISVCLQFSQVFSPLFLSLLQHMFNCDNFFIIFS